MLLFVRKKAPTAVAVLVVDAVLELFVSIQMLEQFSGAGGGNWRLFGERNGDKVGTDPRARQISFLGCGIQTKPNACLVLPS